MRVAYVVSRFPHVTETFIVRELEAVDRDPDVDIELLSLFPPVDPTVHPVHERWTGRVRRPSPRAAAAAVAWWLLRRPLRTISTALTVVAGCWRRPGILMRSSVTLPLALAHARRLAADPVDHVHAHYATYPALAAWVVRRLVGIPYSFTVHAHDVFVHQEMLARKVADASFVVAISEYNREFLRARTTAATPIEVVHCGIDPAVFDFRPRPIPATGPIRAACVASLQEYKGHEVLLRALVSGRAELDRIVLDLVGDGALRRDLERLARALGVADRVRFHGSLPEAEVRAVLDAADLFVLPSVVARDGQMEGIPVALMEALASGLPVVSTRLSGIPELVRDGETGALAEPGDPDGLAAALVRAIERSPGAWAAAGRELVERQFDIDASGRRMAELFHAAADRRS